MSQLPINSSTYILLLTGSRKHNWCWIVITVYFEIHKCHPACHVSIINSIFLMFLGTSILSIYPWTAVGNDQCAISSNVLIGRYMTQHTHCLHSYESDIIYNDIYNPLCKVVNTFIGLVKSQSLGIYHHFNLGWKVPAYLVFL